MDQAQPAGPVGPGRVAQGGSGALGPERCGCPGVTVWLSWCVAVTSTTLAALRSAAAVAEGFAMAARSVLGPDAGMQLATTPAARTDAAFGRLIRINLKGYRWILCYIQ